MTQVPRLLIFVLLAYGLFVCIAFLLQRSMLYFPDRSRPTAAVVHAAGLEFWPPGAEIQRGYLGTNPPANPSGTVVVFHGNAGSAWRRSYYVHALERLGYRVVLAEYPGYGGRSGRPSERTLVDDAQETVRLVNEQFGGPIYLWGESLGSGVTAAVAGSREFPVAGVILLTPWNNLPDLAQQIYWYLPVRWLLLDRYDSADYLRTYSGPTAMVVAEQDEVIPRPHSLNLYARLSEPKRLWSLPRAGHNSWPTDPQEPWWREVMDFVATRG